MTLPFLDENIDFVHRTGKTDINKNAGKKVKPIIVKFKSWKTRQRFHNGKPKHFTNSKRRPVEQLFSVSVDLTKRCIYD